MSKEAIPPPARRAQASKTANPWIKYEIAKRELPPLTPAKYAAACRALAKRFGL